MTNIHQILKKTTLNYIEKYCISKSDYKIRSTAIQFNEVSLNFICLSYREINNHDDWKKRLFGKSKEEITSSNSSDVLLMNIFCYPQLTEWKGPLKLLNLSRWGKPVFGWDPGFINEKNRTGGKTDIDMKIGNTIFEAKLTEENFKNADEENLDEYEGFAKIFDKVPNEKTNYQLIRNILAAYKHNLNFTLLVDTRRPDLIRRFLHCVSAVKEKDLRLRCNFVTWQELTATLGDALKNFLILKYGF